jgi:hypothetical protein
VAQECSAFTIVLAVLDRLRVSAAREMAAVAEATEEAAPKWG